MNEGNVLLVLVVVGGAFLLAIPGAIAFVRSLSVGRGEVDLFQRVRALEAEVEALRRELVLVRTDRDRVQTELAAAKARIGELEDLMAAYQAMGGEGLGGSAGSGRVLPGGSTRTRTRTPVEYDRDTDEHGRRSPVEYDRGTTGTRTGLVERRKDLQRQLAVVEGQITAAGGEKRAPAELVVHRDDLRIQMVAVEGELDGRE